MTIDPTITYGAVINAFVLFIGFVVAFTRIGGRIDLLAQRLERVEKAVERLGDNNTRIAILEERVTNHGKMIATNQAIIEDLRKGNGFISSPRQNIDGAC